MDAQEAEVDFRAASRGRASLVLLLAAALVVVIAAVWFTRKPGGSPGQAAPAPIPAAPAPARPATELAPPAEPGPLTRESGAAGPSADPLAPAAPPAEPRLRMEIVDASGVPVTGDFDLEIRLHLNLQDGLARADPVRTTAGAPRIDLAIAVANEALRAALANPLTAQVVARRLGSHGEAAVPLSLSADADWPRFVVRATSVVRGSILDGVGNPIEGVAVMLRDNTPGRAPHSSAVTDAAGSFAIDALPDVRNRLFVGDERYPWSPVKDLEPSAGVQVLEPIRVDLYSATFRVQRPDGSAAEGAQLEGIGLDGGRFAAKADAEGRARVTTLLRGRWRVNAAAANHGRASRSIEIPLATDEPVLILLPR